MGSGHDNAESCTGQAVTVHVIGGVYREDRELQWAGEGSGVQRPFGTIVV